MVLQFPKPNLPTARRSRSEIGGLSTDLLEDASDHGTTRVRPNHTPSVVVPTKAHSSAGSSPSRPSEPTSVPGVTTAAVVVDPNDELLSRVTAVLDGVMAFRRLHVDVALSEVTITGSVDSEFEKQILFRSLKRISGAKRWIDEVVVVAPKALRESWLTRFRDSLTDLSHWLTSVRSLRWGVAIGVAALLLVLAPWATRSHGIDTVAVTANVSFEGQPAVGAFVVLHPIGESPLPNNVHPAGYVSSAGRVKFTTFETQDGVPAGDYLVSVRWNKMIKNGEESSPGPNVLPERYLLAMTSGLRITVEAGQTELPPLKLTR